MTTRKKKKKKNNQIVFAAVGVREKNLAAEHK